MKFAFFYIDPNSHDTPEYQILVAMERQPSYFHNSIFELFNYLIIIRYFEFSRLIQEYELIEITQTEPKLKYKIIPQKDYQKEIEAFKQLMILR